MIKDFKGQTAVLTGAGSGFGLECARLAAARGMNLVLVDIRQEPLDSARKEAETAGVQVLARVVDVSDHVAMEALAGAVADRFGAPAFVFNNAGVAASGLVWENTVSDWEWVLGVNLWGVVHGVRLFTPMMLAEAARNPSYRGHIINTASMAGLLAPPNLGMYNTAKSAVVSLTETLYHDLGLVTDQISASVLCPYFVPTGIAQSDRYRPAGSSDAPPTKSQLIGQAMSEKAVASSRVTAAEIAAKVFAAMEEDHFYIYSHPKALANVERRSQAMVAGANPPDPFAERPQVRAELRAQLRDSGNWQRSKEER
jgi:NAD(P)-dependent dehydrogenase (short-subunit alcohol dehydrogenase family)